MSNFKPQVTYMTSESLHDYRVDRYRVTSPNITKSFKTYADLKKALKDYILDNHIINGYLHWVFVVTLTFLCFINIIYTFSKKQPKN